MFSQCTKARRFLYHYTNRDAVLTKILPSEQLRLGTISSTNDPRDSKNWSFHLYARRGSVENSRELFNQISDQINDLILRRCKVLCLTRDDPAAYSGPLGGTNVFGVGYAQPRMWAQYSDNHTGVCLVLDWEKLSEQIAEELNPRGIVFEGPVAYANATEREVSAFDIRYNDIERIGIESVAEEMIKKHHQAYYFQKARDWEQEWEYRFVVLSRGYSSEFVSITTALRGIIVGTDFPNACIPTLRTHYERMRVPAGRINWRNGIPTLNPRLDDIFKPPKMEAG